MSSHSDVRVGLGHDIHRLVPGMRLVLGGVEIPSEVGFNTHSDGDVLSHAIVDAMAGALADGDLGTHFPEDDPGSWNARSLDFIREFNGRVGQAAMRVSSIDSFVVLGTTRLRPYIDQMRTNIASVLDLPIARVSVKARSNDGLGPEGNGLAASSSAVVLLIPVTSGTDVSVSD